MQFLKYHFFSFIYTVWGFWKIGIIPSAKVFLARYIPGLWKIQPRNYSHPIWLRGKTSDTKLFFDIIIHEEYPLPSFKPDLIIDAGANIGLFSSYYANKFPNIPVVSIEPESSNFEMLLKNTSRLPNVNCMKKGLWGEDSRLRIKNADSQKWAFELEPALDGEIESVGLNKILYDLGSEAKLVLLKMDIEGADRDVLARNLQWIENLGGLYIEVHGSWRELFRAIDPFDYDIVKMRENLLITFHP
jgi:FkbM family methyltransferase